MRKQTTDNLTYFLECQEQRMYREERDRDKVNGYTGIQHALLGNSSLILMSQSVTDRFESKEEVKLVSIQEEHTRETCGTDEVDMILALGRHY